ncbi:MAG: hypothetical protein E4G97_04940 [Deltaproteobacteria bacterium]|nr:MAG: hypothetical protein E4G97_04940 [Deltaproteobacteria bacterium]
MNAVADSLSIQWSVNVIRAALPGETVIGESRIIHKGRKTMVCDLTVTADDGRLLVKGQATALPVPRDTFAEGTRTRSA